jgi:predicted permease
MTWKWFKRRNGSTADELAEEMALHIQEKAEALQEGGLSPREAMAAARRAFGNQALLQDRSYAIWQSNFLAPLVIDFKSAIAQIKRAPLFALAAILIIAIGIGANTSIFTVLYSVTLKNLPVKSPKDLVFIELAGPKINPDGINLTPPLFAQLRAKQTSFSGVAAWTTNRVTFSDSKDSLLNLNTSFVSDNFFDLLGVDPLLGRFFDDQDDGRTDRTGVWPVVLNYAFWQEHFHGDPSAIGQRVSIANRTGIIIGVVVPAFDGVTPGSPPKIFLPTGFLFDQKGNASAPPISGPAAPVVLVIGRLKPGRSISEAKDDLKEFNSTVAVPSLAPYVSRQPYLKGASIRVRSASHGIPVLDRYRRILVLLQTLMAAALLLCCINVTAIQLALAYERSHEFAVRIALGANRLHLARQCLVESFVLALCGAILSLPIPFFSLHLLPDFLTSAGSAEAPVLHFDWTIFAAAGAFLMVVTMMVGIIPAFFASRTKPGSVLKARSVLGRPPFLLGRVLVTLQITLAFLLISTAIFFVRSSRHLRGEELGFRLEHVVEVSAQFQWLPLSPPEVMALYRKMLHQLRAEKGIEAATLTWTTPLSGDSFQMEVHAAAVGTKPTVVNFNQVGPGYFDTLQTELIAGREFTDEDDNQTNCILNNLAAKTMFGGKPGLGALVVGRQDAEFPIHCVVVGIVRDAKYADIHAPYAPTLYVPITVSSLSKGNLRGNMVFLLRAEQDRDITTAYQNTLAKLSPGTSYMRFLPLRIQMNQALGRDELLSVATILFAAIALPLCGASVLSLLSVRVKQNATDIAIRVALGATPFYVTRLVMQESLALFAAGIALGIPAFYLAAFSARHYLNQPLAVGTFAVTCAVLLLAGVSICAGGLPAIQASRLQPMSLLCRDS